MHVIRASAWHPPATGDRTINSGGELYAGQLEQWKETFNEIHFYDWLYCKGRQGPQSRQPSARDGSP